MIKKDWQGIFSSVEQLQGELLNDWFSRIAQANDLTFTAVKSAWGRYKNEIKISPQAAPKAGQSVPINVPQADFTTFSDKYVMPEGIDESRPPFILECKKLWVGGDFHFPFHDRTAIMTALTQAEGCDVILLNGDVMDCYAQSRFVKNPMHRLVKQELDLVRDFLEYLRGRFKKARILYKFGNHDKRHQDYINTKAEALADLDDVLLPKLLRLEMHGIEEVHHTQLIKAGRLNIIHGHEFGGGASTINVGRSMLLKSFDNIMFNHWHVENSYVFRKINQHIVGAWAVGCLCKLRPEYRPFNGWVNGFATVDFEGENFEVHNKKIIDGKIY